MNWEDLRHFSAFVTSGTLAGAARALGMEHATVARRIAALEDQLGLKLVDRRGRRLTLTPDGERIAAIVQTMEGDVASIERAAAGARSGLIGTVSISAPPALAAARLVLPLSILRREHPGLEIRLIGETRSAILEKREADIAIRLSRPEGGDLTISKLGEISFRLYASPDYLSAIPESDWTFIGYDESLADAPQQGKLSEIAGERRIAFTTNTAEIQMAAAQAGAGVAILPDFMADGDASLVCVRPNEPVFRRDVWLAVHSDMKRAAGIRAVMDSLKRLFPAG